METTWVQKLEEAKKERNSDTAEVTCQTDELEASGRAISAEELDSRLAAQKQQLQLEADEAVEEARKQIQRELEEKHLNDITKQVRFFFFTKANKLYFTPAGIILLTFLYISPINWYSN